MGKQLELTKAEQEIIHENLRQIAVILLNKMDNGVDKPEIKGNLVVKNENRVIEFNIKAKKIK